MTDPVRIRLSRAKGFDLQAHSKSINGLAAVNVARPSAFGNPFVVGKDGNRAECVDLYSALLAGYLAIVATPSIETQKQARAAIVARFDELRGKNLACWCSLGGACHAQLLIDLAKKAQP